MVLFVVVVEQGFVIEFEVEELRQDVVEVASNLQVEMFQKNEKQGGTRKRCLGLTKRRVDLVGETIPFESSQTYYSIYLQKGKSMASYAIAGKAETILPSLIHMA